MPDALEDNCAGFKSPIQQEGVVHAYKYRARLEDDQSLIVV